MLDRARHLIINELCISRTLREADAIHLLDGVLEKASLRMPEAL